MKKIAVVDDDFLFCEKVQKLLGKDFSIDQYHEGESFLPHANDYDLVILDVEIPDLSGIEIKNQVTKPLILFVSNYKDKVLDAFGINVIAYLDKGDAIFSVQLRELILHYTHLPSITIGDTIFLLEDIIYLEGQGSYTCVHAADDNYLFRKTLRDFQYLLDHHFVRIHKSYIINIKSVTKLKVKEVVLDDVVLPVSRSHREELKQAYLRFAYE